jgi:hypothetical protein
MRERFRIVHENYSEATGDIENFSSQEFTRDEIHIILATLRATRSCAPPNHPEAKKILDIDKKIVSL